MSEETPLYIEPMVGWRTWRLETDQTTVRSDAWSVSTPEKLTKSPGKADDGHFRLISGGAEWPPRERLTALCRLGGDHRSPDPKCRCGIYAARSHRILRERGYAAGPEDRDAPDLVGELWMWGRMMESSEILRAEFAYPKKLYVPHRQWRLAKPLEETYGVPVLLCNPFTMEVT